MESSVTFDDGWNFGPSSILFSANLRFFLCKSLEGNLVVGGEMPRKTPIWRVERDGEGMELEKEEFTRCR